MTFTPGPWEIRRGRATNYVYVDIGDSGTVILDGAYTDSEANARLIAAAPELYEVLEDLFVADMVPRALLLEVEALLSKVRGQ